MAIEESSTSASELVAQAGRTSSAVATTMSTDGSAGVCIFHTDTFLHLSPFPALTLGLPGKEAYTPSPPFLHPTQAPTHRPTWP
jgi:hypothetical protein